VDRRVSYFAQASPNEVVFHGWPREWVDAPAKLEEVEVIAGNGYRIETAELIEIVRFVSNRARQAKVRLESSGIRSQLVSLLASALEPAMFSELVNRHGMQSLNYVMQKPVAYEAAPDVLPGPLT
jgi:hypothetical protein